MRIVTLEGNTIVDVFDGKKESGKFKFFFCENGVFYLDTTIGKMWKLDDPICKEHREMVHNTLKEIANES